MTVRRTQRNERLKVLFVTAWYPSPQNPLEGIFVREHVRAANLRDEVALLHLAGAALRKATGHHQLLPIIDPLLQSRVPALRVTYELPPVPKIAYIVYLWTALSAYSNLVRNGFRPDVIHAQTYSAGAAAVLIGAIHRLPVVVSEHSSSFPDRRLSRLEIMKARIAFGQARAVLPVSEYLRRSIESLGFRATYKVVPNAVDTDIFYPAERSAVSATKRLLFVGLLKPVKGFPLLLEALRRVPAGFHWSLDVVGDGPDREVYQRIAVEFGIANRITFHGTKTKLEVADFMRQSDCLVVSSRTETQGCVVLEAMASGLPVIATSVGGIPEILHRDAGILVKPDDPVAFSMAVIKLLQGDVNMPPPASVKSIRANFSLDAIGAQLEDIYRDLKEPVAAPPESLAPS